MTGAAGLLDPETPPFLLADCDDAQLGEWVAGMIAERPGATIRIIRGKQSATALAFLAEAAAALQLPLYFGGGWNAFDECLRQYWLPTEAIIAVVADAGLLFAEEHGDAWEPLVSIVGAADSPARPLRFVLQVASSGAEPLRSAIESHAGRSAPLRIGP